MREGNATLESFIHVSQELPSTRIAFCKARRLTPQHPRRRNNFTLVCDWTLIAGRKSVEETEKHLLHERLVKRVSLHDIFCASSSSVLCLFS